MNLHEYVEDWKKQEEKEENNPEFIKAFVEYMQEEERYWFFDGENGYCGYTASVADSFNPWCDFDYEFAYDSNSVKVFTARHDGYWVSPYISLTGDDAKEILQILGEKLMCWGGLKA